MLILTRKLGEALRINDTIEIKVIEINGEKVKLGISAPEDVRILRSELCQTVEANKDAASSKPAVKLTDLRKSL